MRKVLQNSQECLRKAWWWLRQVSGDAAYENYLQHADAASANAAGRVTGQCRPAARSTRLSRREFYQQLHRRSAGMTRCC